MIIRTGIWADASISALLRDASMIKDTGGRIAFISERFIGTPYQASTLIGDSVQKEELVIDLSGVDCFTFLDYVEAMRRASDFDGFMEALRAVRYRSSEVSYDTRNHFFSDWPSYSPTFIEDITASVGGGGAVRVGKRLNEKGAGTMFLPGIPAVDREITFVPTGSIDEEILGRLQTGDYAGIYTEAPGLDVTHVGIIIRKYSGLLLRHASSIKKQVADEDLREYISDKPGLIIFRPGNAF